MKSKSLAKFPTVVAAAACLMGCSDGARKSPDVTDSIRKSLDQASLRDVKVAQDRENGVVTLTGEVNSQTKRAQVEKLAAGVPNVQQVVNELQVKNQKATSTQ